MIDFAGRNLSSAVKNVTARDDYDNETQKLASRERILGHSDTSPGMEHRSSLRQTNALALPRARSPPPKSQSQQTRFAKIQMIYQGGPAFLVRPEPANGELYTIRAVKHEHKTRFMEVLDLMQSCPPTGMVKMISASERHNKLLVVWEYIELSLTYVRAVDVPLTEPQVACIAKHVCIAHPR